MVRGTPHINAVQREDEQVRPLELFFDLVFVLAITQCTALMAADPSWTGLARGMLTLGILWWCWVGYAWLTSVIDPDEGAVRIAVFAAMAGLLVVSLCVTEAFGDLALGFAGAYGLVRVAHIALFLLGSRDNPDLRSSVWSLAGGTAVGVGLLVGGAFLEGAAQGAVWTLALALDAAGPFLFGADGWRLEPGHFAERHGLIILIALGESIVAIGAGSEVGVDGGVVAAAVVGIALTAAMWWAYFDVVAFIAGRHLAAVPEGRARNELARDAYSYLHFPMVAGIVLAALGLKKTLLHVGDPLDVVPALALVGGVSLYLLGHVGFRLRNVGTLNRQRLLVAGALLATIPLATRVPALATLTGVTVVMWAMITYEAVRFAEARDRVRHADSAEPPSS